MSIFSNSTFGERCAQSYREIQSVLKKSYKAINSGNYNKILFRKLEKTMSSSINNVSEAFNKLSNNSKKEALADKEIFILNVLPANELFYSLKKTGDLARTTLFSSDPQPNYQDLLNNPKIKKKFLASGTNATTHSVVIESNENRKITIVLKTEKYLIGWSGTSVTAEILSSLPKQQIDAIINLTRNSNTELNPSPHQIDQIRKLIFGKNMKVGRTRRLLPNPVIKEILRSPNNLQIYGISDIDQHEIRIFQHLQKNETFHPNIIKMYQGGENFIALEYAKGIPVHKIIKKLCINKGNLYPLMKFCEDVTNGLTFLSLNDVRHGDLKTDNIIMCDDGTYKIIDFGESTICREGETPRLGSMTSNDPGSSVPNPKTDCWCLGLILLEAIGFPNPEDNAWTLIFESKHKTKNLIDDLINKSVLSAKFRYSETVLNNLISLIQGLLNPDIEQRWSATQAYNASLKLKNLIEKEDLDKFEIYISRKNR